MVTAPSIIIPNPANDSNIIANITNISNYSIFNGSSDNHVIEIPRPITAPLGPENAKEFPLALVVASAVVAVSIVIFFCIAYYWHSSQLDKRAQMLAIQQVADAECGLATRSPERERPMIEESPGNGHPGGGGIAAGRKNRGRRVSSPTNSGGKRGSTVTDKDILTHYAARRHSTFFI
ncbi:hypothetical protein SNE40_020929 [Patella caerulea]|uniref:Uncharacterized protein n=1 Tax=Patella caerulea TaxID=87958 RepID=A0AAN8IZS6_PATCE